MAAGWSPAGCVRADHLEAAAGAHDLLDGAVLRMRDYRMFSGESHATRVEPVTDKWSGAGGPVLSGGPGPRPADRIALQQVAVVRGGHGEHRGARPVARATGGVHPRRDGGFGPGVALTDDLLVAGRVVGEFVDVAARPAEDGRRRLGRRRGGVEDRVGSAKATLGGTSPTRVATTGTRTTAPCAPHSLLTRSRSPCRAACRQLAAPTTTRPFPAGWPVTCPFGWVQPTRSCCGSALPISSDETQSVGLAAVGGADHLVVGVVQLSPGGRAPVGGARRTEGPPVGVGCRRDGSARRWWSACSGRTSIDRCR